MFYAHLIHGILNHFVDGTKFVSTSSPENKCVTISSPYVDSLAVWHHRNWLNIYATSEQLFPYTSHPNSENMTDTAIQWEKTTPPGQNPRSAANLPLSAAVLLLIKLLKFLVLLFRWETSKAAQELGSGSSGDVWEYVTDWCFHFQTFLPESSASLTTFFFLFWSQKSLFDKLTWLLVWMHTA